MKKNIDTRSIKSILEDMSIGEEYRFPAARLRSVAAICSDYGFMTGKRFSTKKDRERMEVVVTREN